jgi:HlyD family secretion protein
MAVQISPSSVHKEEFGVLLGKVVSVGDFPATEQGMLRVLGNTSLVRALSQAGAPVEVRVELIKAQTASGYQWSSPQGPPFAVESGTFCTAAIVVAERRPISLVIGGPQ